MTEPHQPTQDSRPGKRTESAASPARLHRNSDGHVGMLAVRLLDDVVRIVEAEVKLLEVNFGSALTAALDRAVGRFLAALLAFLGACCLLAGIIMLLNHWLMMWQALLIAGGVAFAAGIAIASAAGHMARSAESKLTES